MAKKLSLSDLTTTNRRPSWAADVRQNYLRNREQDENAYARAKAAADSIAEAEGVVLPEAQIRDMARQYKETGDFNIQVPPRADFSGVTSSAETFPTPGVEPENPGILNRLGQYAGSTVDAAQAGVQRWMAGAAYTEADTAPAAPAVEDISSVSGLLGELGKAILGGARPLNTEGREQLRGIARDQSAAARANDTKVQGTRDLLERQSGVEKWTTQAVLDAAGSPTGALSLIGGPLATIGVKDVYDQSYMEARERGLSEEEAGVWATAQAAPEMIGYIPAGKLFGAGRKAAAKTAGTSLAEKLTSPGIAAGLRVAKTMAGEGAEEAATGALQDLTAAAISGMSEQEKLRNFAKESLPKDAGEFVERRAREAAAGAVFGALSGPSAVRQSRNEFNQRVNERADTTADAATRSAQEVADRNAAPVIPVPRRQARTEVEQPDLFPDTQPGPNSQVPEQVTPEAPTDSPMDDTRVAEQRRNTLRGLIENEQASIADLEARKAEAPLLREAGYDNFTPQDEASLGRSRERVTALQNELGRWEGGAVSQPVLPLSAPKQPKAKEAKPVQTRGGDTYINPDLTTGSNRREAARREATKALEAQSRADNKAAADATKKAKAAHNASRRKTLEGLTTQAKTMPADQRADFIADGIVDWDNDNPVPTEGATPVTPAPQVTNAAPTPVVAPTPAKPAAPPAKPGTVDATLEDISNKLALGMQEQTQANTPSAPKKFDPEEYKTKIKDVVQDLARTNTQQTVDAVNLINQGKLVLAPTPESIGRQATTDVAQFEPSDGKMYLYTDRLGKGDTLGAVIRTYHEATHAGQFNDRDGRPDVMQQIMGKGPAAKAQSTVLRAAQNGNAIAKRAVDKAQKAAGGNAAVENLEILPYFVGEVVAARGSTLGQLRGVSNDILASAKKFVGKATGKQFDVDMRDLEKAVSGVGREIVQTDVAPTQGDTASMIYPEQATGFKQALEDGRVYTSSNGRRQFVLTDADSTIKPAARTMLETTAETGMPVWMSDVMDHPTLYSNLPEARNIQIRVDPTMNERNMGRYWPGQNLVEVAPHVVRGEAEATLRETVLHEVQHWAQEQGGGMDAFSNATPRPASEQKAIQNFQGAKVANDLAVGDLLAVAGRIATEMPNATDKAIARSIINSPRTDFRKAQDLANLVNEVGLTISDPEAKAAFNLFADTLNDFRKYVGPYNAANKAAYKRYVTSHVESEAFFTQRNADTGQQDLPINPEMEDSMFGTTEGADMGMMALNREARTAVLGMSDTNEVNPVASRWAPTWMTGLFRADKGLSKVDNEIIEHAIASPAGYRMKAEAEMGKYDYALDRLAAEQGKNKAQLDKEIQQVIDGLPKDLTTHADNVDAFNKAMAPYGKAGEALKAMRDQVDELTMSILQQRADSGIPLTEADKKLYKTLVENMGKYTHRQYAAHAGQLGNKYATAVWKDYEKYKSGKGRDNPTVAENYKKVADATKYLVDKNLSVPDDENLSKLGADQTRNLYNTWGKVGNPDGLTLDQMKQELAENRDRINGNANALTSESETIAKELLGLAPVNSPITTYYRGGKQDMGILKQREAIAPVLRSLMGEIVDPSMRMVMTVAKQAEFVGRNRMLLELARSTEGDILPPGTARPQGWTRLEGPGYGPLEGYIASPNMVSAIGDVQQQLATFEQAVAMSTRNPRELGTAVTNKILDAWGVAAGTSKMLQVIWSPMNFVYNFVGGPFTMLTNGNVNPVNMGKGVRASWDLVSYAVNPKSATDIATRLVKNDVVDSAFVGEIKNEQYRELRKVVQEMSGRKGNPTMEWMGEMLHKGKAGFKETYAMMDVLYKIANFYHQVDTLTDFYKKNGDVRTPEQIDREAADVVKRTNFTYRRVAPLLKAIESKGFSAFGPYMHEVFRTQIAGVFQGLGEIRRAGEAKTPEARNVMLLQGTKRLTGTAAAWGMIGAASSLLSGITFGEDDDENEAKRALLPEYLQDQDFVEIGKDAKGQPVMFNVSRFDPIGPATDLMRGILQGGIEPDKLSDKMLDLYVLPRIGPQVATAIGTMGSASVKVNRVPLVQELAPEQYSTLLDIAKQVGIPARVAKAWTNVAETLYPGIASSWRSSNARPTSPDDATTSTFNTATYLGMTLQSLDPSKPVRFAGMSYSDSVKQGRSELVEMFKDNPDRTVEQVVAQVLTSRANERQAYDDLRKTYQGARALGVPQRQLMAQMKDLKLNGEQIRAVTSGNFSSSIISLPSLATYEKRELQDKPKSEHREIKQKWKDIRELLKTTSRQMKSEDEE